MSRKSSFFVATTTMGTSLACCDTVWNSFSVAFCSVRGLLMSIQNLLKVSHDDLGHALSRPKKEALWRPCLPDNVQLILDIHRLGLVDEESLDGLQLIIGASLETT